MDYVSIFDSVEWPEIGKTIIQTVTIYWFLLLGLKAIGRRVFAEMGPQDLIILLLIAESCDLGLASEKAGYWGTIASVATILIMGAVIERIPPLRRFLDSNKVLLFEDGKLDRKALRRNLVEEEDLEKTAREYGLASYKDFLALTLEGDGSITGIIKPELTASKKTHIRGIAG